RGIEVIDASSVALTTDAEGLFEHMRRCAGCTDAALDWAEPIIREMGQAGGRIRTSDFAEVKAQLRLNHDVVDNFTRMYVTHMQTTGQLSALFGRVADRLHETRGQSDQ